MILMTVRQRDSLPLSPVLFLNLSLFSLPLLVKLQNRKLSLISSENTTWRSSPATTNMGFEILKQFCEPPTEIEKGLQQPELYWLWEIQWSWLSSISLLGTCCFQLAVIRIITSFGANFTYHTNDFTSNMF